MKHEPRRSRPDSVTPQLSVIEHPGRLLLAAALGRFTEPQRTMLALMLVERLSSAEAAMTLGITIGQFERSYRALTADLRRSMDRTNRMRWRSAARLAREQVTRLRKAS
jgi:DNA-directed RNA polymerase specialized sigma24 family protein